MPEPDDGKCESPCPDACRKLTLKNPADPRAVNYRCGGIFSLTSEIHALSPLFIMPEEDYVSKKERFDIWLYLYFGEEKSIKSVKEVCEWRLYGRI